MKKLLLLVALSSFFVLFVNSCSDSSTGPTKPAKDIDELVRNAGKLDKSVVKKDDIIEEKPLQVVEEDGKKWNLKQTTRSLAENLGDGIPFNVNANTLWAGSLVQGKDLPNGVLSSLGDNIDRNKITITVNSGAGLLGSKEIVKPSNSTYSAALQDILNNNNTKITAKQSFSLEYAYSEKQALMKLGISANWLGGGLSSQFSTEEKATQKSIFLMFKQTYFTVSTTEPTKPSDFFGDNIKTDDLSYYVNQNNPLCYVSSVDYGRIILVKMTYQENISSTELKAKVNQTFMGFNAGANGEYVSKFTDSKATFQGLILGGSAGGAAKALTAKNFQGIVELINQEAEYTINTPPYPISYVVKNLADNSTVKLGETTEYTVKEYSENSENYQNFKIYLYGFIINKDCDDDGTRGDFFYEFDVVDKNDRTLIGGKKYNTEEINKEDGERIEIKETTKTFTLPNTKDSYFKVKGFLYDKDVFGNEKMGDFEIIFNYPWNENDLKNDPSNPYYYKKDLSSGNTCNGTLYFQIIKE